MCSRNSVVACALGGPSATLLFIALLRVGDGMYGFPDGENIQAGQVAATERHMFNSYYL